MPGAAEIGRLYAGLAPVVERAGKTFPAAAVSLRGSDPAALVTCADGEQPVDPVLSEGGRAHLERLRSSRARLHDGPVLALVSMEEDGRLTAACSGYFAMLATADALRQEFSADGFGPLRRRAHELAGDDPLRNGAGRCAAIGITIAVTVREGGSRRLLIGRRRDDLGTDPGRLDVAPSGMLEPGSNDPLLAAARRECSEELGVTPGPAGLSVLGVGFDLLRLRPEVMLELSLEPGRGPAPALAPAEFQSSELIELSEDGLADFWRGCSPEDITPTGAACLALLER